MRYELKDMLKTLQSRTIKGNTIGIKDLLDRPLTADKAQLKKAIRAEIKGIQRFYVWGYFMQGPDGIRVTADNHNSYDGTIYNIQILLSNIELAEFLQREANARQESKDFIQSLETGTEIHTPPNPAVIRLKTIEGTHIKAKCKLLKESILKTLEATPDADSIFFDRQKAHVLKIRD